MKLQNRIIINGSVLYVFENAGGGGSFHFGIPLIGVINVAELSFFFYLTIFSFILTDTILIGILFFIEDIIDDVIARKMCAYFYQVFQFIHTEYN